MATARPAYCALSDVQSRLYAEEDPAQIPSGAVRDTLLTDLIQILSREFDELCGRPPGCFVPSYDMRLFSGRGAQLLDTDEYASLLKIEINQSPGTTPVVWTDFTSEVGQGLINLRPIRYWPKDQVYRQRTFYVDPYHNGNVRLTGVFGCIQPDAGAVAPVAGWNGLSTPQITSLQPTDASGNPVGWWITPEHVKNCVAQWCVYNFKSSQAGYGDKGGGMNAPGLTYSKQVPDFVTRVVTDFARETLKVAMIGLDGTDFSEEAAYPGQGNLDAISRWAGWQTR